MTDIRDTVASEFDLIARYFKRPVPAGMLGGGDDCALFAVPEGMQVATSTDLLLESRHFFSDVDPFKLGIKALAVNLSDLAAMGATPIGCLLGIALPRIDEGWIKAFADGFYTLVDRHACPLIGGDTTRSESDIAISVTVFGAVDPAKAMRRSSACIGDDIWVSGYLGAADIACSMMLGQMPMDLALLDRTRLALEQPAPRIDLGKALSAYAHAAIDISDGLAQDLQHILKASRCGAQLHESLLPIAPVLQGIDPVRLRQAALAGGDVYELCWTAPIDAREAILKIGQTLQTPVTRIGSIISNQQLIVYDSVGSPLIDLPFGFDHFRT